MLAENLQELSKQNLISLALEQQIEIEKLTNAIRNANKKLFGTKSEKLTTEDQQQLKLSFDRGSPRLQSTASYPKVHRYLAGYL